MQPNILNNIERLIFTVRTYQWMLSPTVWWYAAGGGTSRRIDRPIFLLGVQGGGLTLLSRMLRRGGQLVSGSGGPSYWTSADEIQNSFGLFLPQELSGTRWKRPPHPLFSGPRSWTYAARELFSVYRKVAGQNTPEIQSRLKSVIRSSLARYARHDHAARFIDKSQTYTVRVGLIHAALRKYEPRFVLMPRDPYISVYRAAIGKAEDMRRLSNKISYKDRIDICAEHYGNSIRAVYEDVKNCALEVHLCRFEDLIENPRQVLQGVCAFTELNYMDDMIPAAHHRIPFGSRYRDRWYPLRQSVNAAYESHINDLVINAVNKHCGDIIESLGYSRRRPDSQIKCNT